MLTTKAACAMARKLNDVTQKDHFGGDGFYANKKIFATVWHERQEVNLKLTPALQAMFSGRAPNGMCPVDNAWGRQGWTTVQLKSVGKELFEEALRAAWANSVLKKSSAGRRKMPKKSVRKSLKKSVKKSSKKSLRNKK